LPSLAQVSAWRRRDFGECLPTKLPFSLLGCREGASTRSDPSTAGAAHARIGHLARIVIVIGIRKVQAIVKIGITRKNPPVYRLLSPGRPLFNMTQGCLTVDGVS
jgi:hypothetical protein